MRCFSLISSCTFKKICTQGYQLKMTYLLVRVQSFLSDFGKIVRRVVTCSDQRRLCSVLGELPFTVDSVGGVVEHLLALDWFFQVSASLWNMLSHNGSAANGSESEFKLQKSNETNEGSIRTSQGDLEEQVMDPCDLPSHAGELAKRPLFVPVSDQDALGPVGEFVKACFDVTGHI